MRKAWLIVTMLAAAPAVAPEMAQAQNDWRADRPGAVHHIDPATLPPPYQTQAAGNPPDLARRPAAARLSVPPGFTIQPFAELRGPRLLRTAPNGDVFVAQSDAGQVSILHTQAGIGRATGQTVFASGLDTPFGIAFYPAQNPRYIYIAQTTRLVRYPWHVGATRPDGPPETILAPIPGGDHITRDIVLTPDGSRLLLSIGSGSNDAQGIGAPPAGFIQSHAPGAAWGAERDRATVLSLRPDGTDVRTYATGLRNCAGEAIQPGTATLWCATNERDGLGDDLPPDYVTSVRPGAFYGWPWYYIGRHPDPQNAAVRPDLAAGVTAPDILIQPHSAPLGLAFYTGTMFPAAWRGRGFVALHGSWNRARRTGYKVVAFDPATNAYTDFLTGFVANDSAVWGRPVGLAIAEDGALLVSDDAGGTIWRISY